MKKELWKRKKNRKKIRIIPRYEEILAERSCEKDFKNGAAEELLVTFHVMKLSKAGLRKKTKENAKAVTLPPIQKRRQVHWIALKNSNMLLRETMTTHCFKPCQNYAKKNYFKFFLMILKDFGQTSWLVSLT